MKFCMIVLILSSLFSPVYAKENNDSFSHLDKLQLTSDNNNIIIRYDKKISEIINKKAKHSETRLIKTKIDKEQDVSYIIDFSPGPSVDPMFIISRSLEPNLIKIGVVSGLEIVLPGDGFFYVRGHTNNMFDERRKYSIRDNKIVEIEQPYYYVGLETTANSDITIYSDLTMEKSVAFLSENTKFTVLINKGDYYLIKTPFGLTGWTKVKTEHRPQKMMINGLIYKGD